MIEMEILKKVPVIPSWGYIYLGIKKNWLTMSDILNLAQQSLIKNCNEDDLVGLYLAYDESLFEFLKSIKLLIYKYEGVLIEHHEDQFEDNNTLSFLPRNYWLFWEIEFLLRILKTKDDEETKLHLIANVHSDLNYPKSWEKFIYFMTPPHNIPIGISKMYKEVLVYIENSIQQIETTKFP